MLLRTGTDRACALIITNDVSDIKRKYIVYVVQHKMLLLSVKIFCSQFNAKQGIMLFLNVMQ